MSGKPGKAIATIYDSRELWRVRNRHLDVYEETSDDPQCPYFLLVDDDDGHSVLINKEELDGFTMAFMQCAERLS